MLMEMDMWSVVREWFLNLLFGRETRAVDGVSSTLRFLKSSVKANKFAWNRSKKYFISIFLM